MRTRKGLMLLDVIIIILAAGVVASLLLPYLRTEREIKIRDECRNRMKLLSEAELKYFETAGGKINPAKKDTAATDTTKAEKKSEKKGEKSEEEKIVRVFTKDVSELQKVMPNVKLEDTCPLDGRKYIIVARDSFFFSISCPNGHGQIIMGTPTWEEGK